MSNIHETNPPSNIISNKEFQAARSRKIERDSFQAISFAPSSPWKPEIQKELEEEAAVAGIPLEPLREALRRTKYGKI